jgi:Hypothetical chloroplast protein Ycf34
MGLNPKSKIQNPKSMCICINCEYVDRCTTYHAVEEQHQQAHLTPSPDFTATEPQINVNIRTQEDYVEMEWDVVGCQSFTQDKGKWSRLRPGELIPT